MTWSRTTRRVLAYGALAMATLVVLFPIYAVVTVWNEFILAANFVSREEAFTLPVTLYRHVGSHGAGWGAFAAGSILVIVPVCLLFFALQKQLLGGLSAGAVK